MYNPYLEDIPFVPVAQEQDNTPSEKGLGDLGGILEKFNLSSLSSLKSLLPIKDLLKGEEHPKQSRPAKETIPKEEAAGGGMLDAIKDKLHLDDLDIGDILLVIILIYLMIEGDDKLELAITLGVLALLWLADSKKDE